MKKIIGLAIGMVAMVALSGCNTTVPGSYSNIKIENLGSIEIEDTTVTQVEVINNDRSAFDIVEIYSAPLNDAYTQSFPNDTPPYEIAPGESQIFQSHNCYDYEEEWKIKIVDAYGNVAEGKYNRQCGFREKLLVTNW